MNWAARGVGRGRTGPPRVCQRCRSVSSQACHMTCPGVWTPQVRQTFTQANNARFIHVVSVSLRSGNEVKFCPHCSFDMWLIYSTLKSTNILRKQHLRVIDQADFWRIWWRKDHLHYFLVHFLSSVWTHLPTVIYDRLENRLLFHHHCFLTSRFIFIRNETHALLDFLCTSLLVRDLSSCF